MKKSLLLVTILCAGLMLTLFSACAKPTYQDYNYYDLHGKTILSASASDQNSPAFALICKIAEPYLLTQTQCYEYPSTKREDIFSRVALIHYMIVQGLVDGVDSAEYYNSELDQYVYPADFFESLLKQIFSHFEIDYEYLAEIEIYDPQSKTYQFYHGGYGSIAKWVIDTAQAQGKDRLIFTINVYPKYENELLFYPLNFTIHMYGDAYQYETIKKGIQ